MITTIQDMLTMDTLILKRTLQNIKNTVNGSDYTFLPGTINNPFCIVAHIDTCHRPKVKLIQTNNKITNKHGLLGADDRAGVYAALQIYHRAPQDRKPHLLFTDGEEIGGIGAQQAAELLKPPPGLRLLIELDRKGCNEYVTYETQHKQVDAYAESFGYIKNHGSYSDIADISPAWKVPAINLSIGYYKQHTEAEYLMTDEMDMTINRVLSMIDNPIAKKYKIPQTYNTDWYDYEYPTTNKKYKQWAQSVIGDIDEYELDRPITWNSALYAECRLCCTKTSNDMTMTDGLCLDCYAYMYDK